MAQGKMTSRQRMINMMYLVLLALLALSVSTEVLDSFVSIRSRLQMAAGAAEKYTVDFASYMRTEIDKEVVNRGDRSNVGLKDTLLQIRTETRQIVEELDLHIAEMEKMADWDEEEKQYKRPDELELNYQYWMGNNAMANSRRGNGVAAKLRDSLDTYFAYLAALYNSQVAKDSARISPVKMKDPDPMGREDKTKRWEEYTFDGPVVANLATLEALKIDVFRQEKELMDLLNTRLGAVTFAPDKVEIISAPQATVVPAGLPFRTRLFVGMSSSEILPQFSSSQGQIELGENGNSAWLSIPASGNAIPAGQREGTQTFSATVQVPRATGGYETLTIREEFRVLRPEVLVTSAAIQTLYRACGNAVNIDVPALGDYYNPIVTASGAAIKTNQESRKKFMIIPSGNSCTVSVSNRAAGNTTKIQDIKYRVISPPKPNVLMRVNGRNYNGATAIPRTSRVQLQLQADPEFRVLMPQDARYEIGTVEVLLQNGIGPPEIVKTVDLRGRNALQAQQISLGTKIRQASPGSRAYVKIKEIYRRNYQGERIRDTRFPEMELTMALLLR